MEAAFRIAFILLFSTLLGVVTQVARRLRQRPGGAVNQMTNELPVLRILRPVLGLVFYLALLDWLIPGSRLDWANAYLPAAVRWLGAAFVAAAVALIWWSFSALGANYRGGVGLWEDHELVVTGPYARIRHPIYAAFVVVMLGVWGLTANWLLGISGIALTLSIPAFRLAVEERELRDRFGAEYSDYAAATTRFIPRVF